MQPHDPQYRRHTLENFSRQAFMQHLGARVAKLEPGLCVVEVAGRPEWHQQHGYFHGGLITTLADVAGGYAAFTLLYPDQSNVTGELKINFLAPAAGSALRAVGEVVKAGRTVTVCRCEVYALRNSQTSLCAVALAGYLSRAL